MLTILVFHLHTVKPASSQSEHTLASFLQMSFPVVPAQQLCSKGTPVWEPLSLTALAGEKHWNESGWENLEVTTLYSSAEAFKQGGKKEERKKESG